MQFRKVEHATRQELLKRRRHIQKTRQVCPLLPDKRLDLVPAVLNRVLARVVWCKPQTCDRPVCFGHSSVYRGEIRPHRCCCVMTGIVPDDCQFGVRKAQLPIKQEIGGGQRIGGSIRHEMSGPRDRIHGTIVRLPCPTRMHGQRDALAPFAPHIPTRITPQHKALIHEQHHLFPVGDLLLMGRHIRGQFCLAFGDQGCVFLGLVAWVFFQLKPAACRRS